jgi:thioredoxin-like negative regulator of GroEL
MRILRFTAPWCQPCKELAKNILKSNITLPIEVIDIDLNPELAKEYGIRSVPTLVMLDWNKEVKRITGNKSTKELEEWVNG